MSTIELLEEVAQVGLEVLRDTLRERATDDNQLKLARIAATSVSAYARMYQANSAREGTLVSICREASENGQEFRSLVIAALPASPVVKALMESEKKRPSAA